MKDVAAKGDRYCRNRFKGAKERRSVHTVHRPCPFHGLFAKGKNRSHRGNLGRKVQSPVALVAEKVCEGSNMEITRLSATDVEALSQRPKGCLV